MYLHFEKNILLLNPFGTKFYTPIVRKPNFIILEGFRYFDVSQ